MPSTVAWFRKRVYEAVNHRLRIYGGGRWASYCRPTYIAILLTELCNAGCVHCDIWKNRGKEDSPTVDQWKRVLADLRRWLGPVQVTFTGGEALLKPFTTELVQYGSSLGLFVEILTHGYWDDQSKIEKLALARPWRVTVSLDGVGETHTQIRGRPKFFEKTSTTLRTLQRVRKEQGLDFSIRLKNVIMEHNLQDSCEIARFAQREGFEVFYQPIEQNYNTPEDPKWFEHSPNWPRDTEQAIKVVRQLMQLKRDGLPIANSLRELEVMIPYFRNPEATEVLTKSHTAHERRYSCAALMLVQIQANGDATVCTGLAPVGNIKRSPIREIWENRPHFWEEGCCYARRCPPSEKQNLPSSLNPFHQ